MRSISSPFRSGLLVRSSPRNPTLHFACIASIHLSTARLREILISISQVHSFRFPQALFQCISSGIYFIFCDELAPKYPQFSPPPISCCSHFRQSCFIVCACGRSIHSGSIALRELRSYLSPNPYTTLCLHSCIHLSTARHKYSFSHSIYSVPSVIPMPFSHPFPAVAFLPAAS